MSNAIRGVTYTGLQATDGRNAVWAVYRVPVRGYGKRPIRTLNLHRAEVIATVRTVDGPHGADAHREFCGKVSRSYAAAEWPAFNFEAT